MSTRRYLISKILQALLTLVFVLAFNFFLFRGLGDPLQLISRGHGNMTPQALADERATLGLDLPLPQQFVHYMKETVTGHLGYSLHADAVTSEIGARIWPTLLLIGTSTVASIVLGVWIGIVQGWRRGSKFDTSMLGVTLVLYAMPEFWFGLLMIMLFSV
ncbi:MAG: peptide/nickel transport system permease protein, partial [Actinomycetota bacterium]|nr:peptide/nickel transport system permease protein [Actinomycetota bacterium]